MIDVESQVFSAVSGALRDRYDGIWVVGEFADIPAKFPAVTIIESDNAIAQSRRTLRMENAVNVMYEVNVYTNTVGRRKAEAKEIMGVVSEEFAKLGFVRTLCNPISNLSDATIYRMVARFEGAVSRDHVVYQKS